MAYNEFDGVPSCELKKQLRGIKNEIAEIEYNWVEWEDDSGTRCWDVGAEYWLSDLEHRQMDLKRELAKRWGFSVVSQD